MVAAAAASRSQQLLSWEYNYWWGTKRRKWRGGKGREGEGKRMEVKEKGERRGGEREKKEGRRGERRYVTSAYKSPRSFKINLRDPKSAPWKCADSAA